MPKTQTLRSATGLLGKLKKLLGGGLEIKIKEAPDGIDVNMPGDVPIDEQKTIWSKIVAQMKASGYTYIDPTKIIPLEVRKHIARVARAHGLDVKRKSDSGALVDYPLSIEDRSFARRYRNSIESGLKEALGKTGRNQNILQLRDDQLALQSDIPEIEMGDTPFGITPPDSTSAGTTPAGVGTPPPPPAGLGATPPPPPAGLGATPPQNLGDEPLENGETPPYVPAGDEYGAGEEFEGEEETDREEYEGEEETDRDEYEAGEEYEDDEEDFSETDSEFDEYEGAPGNVFDPEDLEVDSDVEEEESDDDEDEEDEEDAANRPPPYRH